MSATSILMKKGPSISERLVQASLYVILTGFIIFYGRSYIGDLLEQWNLDLPISLDTVTTIVSIIVGILVSTILLFFFKRSVRKEVKRFDG